MFVRYIFSSYNKVYFCFALVRQYINTVTNAYNIEQQSTTKPRTHTCVEIFWTVNV